MLFRSATDVPGNAGLVTGGEHALLVPPGDEAALVAGLRRLLEDKPLAAALGAAARARILADHALDSVARRVAEIYSQL